jgi:hypothetical protein
MTVFAGEGFSVGAFAGIWLLATFFVGAETFLLGASSEAEDSSSDDSSEDSSLELDAAAAGTFVGAPFTGDAFVGVGFD